MRRTAFHVYMAGRSSNKNPNGELTPFELFLHKEEALAYMDGIAERELRDQLITSEQVMLTPHESEQSGRVVLRRLIGFSPDRQPILIAKFGVTEWPVLCSTGPLGAIASQAEED